MITNTSLLLSVREIYKKFIPENKGHRKQSSKDNTMKTLKNFTLIGNQRNAQ